MGEKDRNHIFQNHLGLCKNLFLLVFALFSSSLPMVGHTPDGPVIIVWVLLATYKIPWGTSNVGPSKSLMSH